MRYFNRDISWIDFNARVLEEALREETAPLDRFRFLCIVSSNFDEFFMVRVAAMKGARLSAAALDPSGLSPEEQLRLTAEKVRSIIRRQYDCLRDEILPLLAAGGLELVRPGAYNALQREYLQSLFMGELMSVLTPLRVEEDSPLPSIGSLGIHAAFLLAPAAGATVQAVIRIPGVLNRIIPLPAEKDGKTRWALLEDVVTTWGGLMFPGYTVKERIIFKVVRDADFSVDERRDEDFIEAMTELLSDRERSKPVRMDYSPGSLLLRDDLARRLELGAEDLYEIAGPLDLRTLQELYGLRGFDELRDRPAAVYPSPAFSDEEPLWDRISRGDVLLHHPYQSFDPVVRFFEDAAADPQVIAIKTALYRTSGGSPIIRALERAALAGKHVTAVVEIKARFDEERNISWANRLEKAGVIVVYGLARLKVHAKISLVIRREADGATGRYVHLSTGNYNDRTARHYADLGLFTANADIAYDASLLFNMITGYSETLRTRKLIIAPTEMKHALLTLIAREAARSTPEAPGRIAAKMNSLADPEVIEALYRASQAGVKVSLNVRGICMLVPGVPGLSDTVGVVSIVDRNLEHSRIFAFGSGRGEELYLSSADWMGRNLERRVELMVPVLQEDLKVRLSGLLAAYFRDNCRARVLGPDGAWRPRTPGAGEAPFRAQGSFLDEAGGGAGAGPFLPGGSWKARRAPAK